MTEIRLLAPISLLLAIVLALSCAQPEADGTATPSVPGTPAEAASSAATATAVPEREGPQFGIAGLIPRNFPTATTDDYIAMYEASAEAGTLLGAYANWTDDRTTPGDIPEVFRSSYAAVDQFGAPTPVVAVGFASEDVLTGLMQTNVDWSDPEAVALFTDVVLAIVEEYEPPFFVLGAEINRIWEQHPANFDAFVAAWPALYDAIKAASPGTEVGASFQYEFLRGAGYLSGQTRAPHWEIVDRFEGSLDFVALSTYPFFDYETPEAIPDSYYEEAAERFALPLAFSEMGWPSRPSRSQATAVPRRSRQPSPRASSR
jgi:hypothetical protein